MAREFGIVLPPFPCRRKRFVLTRRFVAVALLAISWEAQIFAQGTRADYERANNLRALTENKVFRHPVQPQWLPGSTQFWYQVKTGTNAHEFIFVDAEKGERKPLFDHARLAKALTDAGIKNADASRLSLDQLEFKPADNAVEFRAGGKSWRYDLATYELRELPTPKAAPLSWRPLEDAPKASRRTGQDTTLIFANRTDTDVELFWLDTDGGRQSYGKLAAGAEREQHTYAGHVWLLTDRAGKTLAIFEAGEGGGRAELREG